MELLAIWLHSVAIVIVVGYYGILGRVVLPALERSLDRKAQGLAILAIERRAVPLVLLALALLTATGIYLLVIDPNYAGLGNVFESTWTRLMLVKHVLVAAFIALGAIVDYLIRQIANADDLRYRASLVGMLHLSVEGATGVGALIILLTAAAQLAT